MRNDVSLDHEIRLLERRIRDRRLALDQTLAGVRESAAAAKARVRERATSPLVWGAALALGFVIVRLVRRRPAPMQATLRVGRGEPPRRAMAALLSAMLPLALRVAQRSLAPWIARTVQGYARRRAQAG